ncbi:MAG: hypothetical protein U0K19_03465, partial [Bifidobacteriaceae bacterium]|nr:hypothetical protein [Bifidobacteriaceae bacterium]
GEERRVIDDAFAHDAVVRGYLELANWLDMALDSCLPVDAAAGAPEPTACAIRLLALAQDGACAKATRRYWSAQGLPWARPDAALDEAREYVGTARSIAAWAGLADELGFDFDEVAGGGE